MPRGRSGDVRAMTSLPAGSGSGVLTQEQGKQAQENVRPDAILQAVVDGAQVTPVRGRVGARRPGAGAIRVSGPRLGQAGVWQWRSGAAYQLGRGVTLPSRLLHPDGCSDRGACTPVPAPIAVPALRWRLASGQMREYVKGDAVG